MKKAVPLVSVSGNMHQRYFKGKKIKKKKRKIIRESKPLGEHKKCRQLVDSKCSRCKESKPLGEHKKCRQLVGSKSSRCRRPGKKTQIYFGRLYDQVFRTCA